MYAIFSPILNSFKKDKFEYPLKFSIYECKSAEATAERSRLVIISFEDINIFKL